MAWYSNKYRRHLCDMHIEDWNDDFLSMFSPEEYFDNLLLARIQLVMIPFQSHVGYCYYPAKVGRIHRAFKNKEDIMKRLIALCQQADIGVVGYYSLIFNNFAHDNYPAWRIVGKDGTSSRGKGTIRYGFCCPNNFEYRQFVYAQMKEISEYFMVNGMFFDMPFWPEQCYCGSCQERWKQEVGGTLPDDEKDENWELFQNKRTMWLGEFVQSVTNIMKLLRPEISVEHNCAFAVLNKPETAFSEQIINACDYVGGDLYESFLAQSFTCKYYYAVTKSQPFEHMTGLCNPNLANHTVIKSKDMLSLAVLMTCAHHGASMMIDGINPVGTINKRVYKRIGEINRVEEEYEPYLTGKMVQDIAVLYCLESRVNLQGQEFNHYTGTINMVKTLIENHIPVGIVTPSLINRLAEYKAVLLSNPNHLSDITVDALIDYVKKGGVLYFSNTDESRLFETLIGSRTLGYTQTETTYLSPTEGFEDVFEGFNFEYPLPFNGKLPIVERLKDCTIAATITLPFLSPNPELFASIHSNPPGTPTNQPGVAIKSFGEGSVIWSAAPIENECIGDYKKILLNLIKKVIHEPFRIWTNAPKMVELITFEAPDEQCIRISLVHLNDDETALVQPSYTVSYITNSRVVGVTLLPENRSVAFKQVNCVVTFQTESFVIMAMYQINYEDKIN